MNDLLITIAIPAYNNAKTIQKTINSCLAQNTTIKYEILIVDDASEDDTSKIISQYNDEKIRIVTLSERVPVMDNHNNCFEYANGQYLLFCHADDMLEDHAIDTISNKLKQRNYPKKYILWGHSLFRDSYTVLNKAGFSINEMIVGEYAPLLFMYGAVAPTGTCYSRKTILELGGFFQTKHKLAPSDITSHIYFALNGFRFEMIDEMIIIRKFASTSTETNIANILDSYDDAFKKLIEVCDQEDIIELIRKSLTNRTKPYRTLYASAQNEHIKKLIRKPLLKDIVYNPLLLRDSLIRKCAKRVFF